MKCAVTFLAFLAVFIGSYSVDACSSVLTHPQVLYCRAEYAIKILVGNVRNVLLRQDGTFIDLTLPDETNINGHGWDGGDNGEGYGGDNEEGDGGDNGEGNGGDNEEGDGVEDPVVTDEETPTLFPPEPIVGSLDGAVGPPMSEDGGADGGEDSNDQPEEAEEAGPDGGTGREIHWKGIRTSSHSRQESAGTSIVDQPIINGGGDHVAIPATIVNDDSASEEASIAEPDRLAAARRSGYLSMYVGPDGAMPGNSEHFARIRGKPLGLRGHVGGPSFNSRRIASPKRSNRRAHRHARYSGDVAPGVGGLRIPSGNPANNEADSGVLMAQYSVTILKVFKGDVINTTQYVYTPPDGGLCIMHLKRKTPYVIMGDFRSFGLYLTQADYKIDATHITAADLRHLTSNMNHRFKKGCDNCYIKVCSMNGACEQDTHQCTWRNMYTLLDPRASQFACVMKKRGTCEWHNDLHPDMTPEDLDEP